MNSITEKISVKNFNNFYENDQPSRAFSRLAERKLKKFQNSQPSSKQASIQEPQQPKYYKYKREELIEISKFPNCKISKTEFISRLKNPNLDEEIITSFQRKERDDRDSFDMVERGTKNHHYNNQEASSNRHQDRIHRFGFKYQDLDSNAPSWRSDRFSPSFRSNKRIENHQDRRKRNRYNNRYDNGSSDFHNEPEPEWFSEGPKSMTDFIDLKGFDDDLNANNENTFDEINSDSFDIQHSKRNSLEKDTSSISDISKDDLYTFLDSLDASKFSLFSDSENFQLTSGNSSRAAKWFGNRKSSCSSDTQQSTSTTISLADLFQKKNIDISQLQSHTNPNLELSKAVNVSDLEASLDSSATSANDLEENKEVISKLSLLAKPQSPVQQSQQQPQPQDVGLKSLLAGNVAGKPPSPLMPNSGDQMNNDVRTPNQSREEMLKYKEMLAKMEQNSMAPGMMHRPNDFDMMRPLVRPPQMFPRGPLLMMQGPGVIPPNAMSFNPFLMGNALNQMLSLQQSMMIPSMNVPQPGNFPGPFPNMNMVPNYAIPPHATAAAAANLMMRPPANFPESVHRTAGPKTQLQSQPTQVSDDSVAHKLLKNSKFTPTSVFRKLKDHDQNKMENKPNKQTSSTAEITEQNNAEGNVKSASARGSITAEMDEFNSFLEKLNLNLTNETKNESINSEKLEDVKKQPSTNSKNESNGQFTKAVVDPFDIFNAFKTRTSNGNPSDSASILPNSDGTLMGLPPLPLKNALTLEDLEKM